MGIFLDHLLNGTYPYLTPEEFINYCPDASGSDPEDENVLDAIEDASLVVYYMTGRQFNGTGTTTVTPSASCWCAPNKIKMGLWPITDIVSVRENGVDQDPTDYHVDEYKYIVKNSGEPFPRSANWYEVSGGPDDDQHSDGGYVFEITVEHGIPAPRLIKRATRAMACSLFDGGSSDDCGLPERVTSVTRAGVTLEVADFVDLIGRGSTGIYEVDLAVSVFNPTRLQSPSFVWTPDMQRGTRRYT